MLCPIRGSRQDSKLTHPPYTHPHTLTHSLAHPLPHTVPSGKTANSTVTRVAAGTPCLFPFYEHGFARHSCVVDSIWGERPWCATAVDARGDYEYLQWGLCDCGIIDNPHSGGGGGGNSGGGGTPAGGQDASPGAGGAAAIATGIGSAIAGILCSGTAV